MTPDTLEGSIHDLTQNILADYTAGLLISCQNCIHYIRKR